MVPTFIIAERAADLVKYASPIASHLHLLRLTHAHRNSSSGSSGSSGNSNGAIPVGTSFVTGFVSAVLAFTAFLL